MNLLISIYYVLLWSFCAAISPLEEIILELSESNLIGNGEVLSSYPFFQRLNKEDRRIVQNAVSYISELKMTAGGPGSGSMNLSTRKNRTKREVTVNPSDQFQRFRVQDISSTTVLDGPTQCELMSNAVEVILDSGTGAMCMVCQEGVVCGLMETPLEDDDFSDHVDNEVFHTFQLVQIPGETKKFYLVHLMYGDDRRKLKISLVTVGSDLSVTFSDVGSMNNYEHVHGDGDGDDHVVTQSGVMSTLLVPDHGIYVSFFNPDTVEVDDDMSVAFYSFENPEDLVYVEGATAVLSPLMILDVNKGIQDMELFMINDDLYLAIARETKSFLFQFSNQGKDSQFSLDSKFKYSSKKVVSFSNSFGTYLIFVNEENESTVNVFKDGSWVEIQSNVNLGNYDQEWRSVAISSADEYNLPEQEIILLSNENKVHFLYFARPSLIIKSKEFSLPVSTDATTSVFTFGTMISALEEGRQIFIYTKNVADVSKEVKIKVFKVNIEEEDQPVSYLSRMPHNVVNTAEEIKNLESKLDTLETDLIDTAPSDRNLILLNADVSKPSGLLTAASITLSGEVTSMTQVNIEVFHETEDPNFSRLDYLDPNSALYILEQETAIDDVQVNILFQDSIMKSSDITIPEGVTLTVPNAAASNAIIHELQVSTIEDPSGEQDVSEFITKSLRTNDASREFTGEVIFAEDVSADLITFVDASASLVAESQRLQPHKMLSIDVANTIGTNIQFENIYLNAKSDFNGNINDIDLEEILANDAGTVEISGSKTFSQGLTVNDGIEITTKINQEAATKYLNTKFVYKHDPDDVDNDAFSQSIQTKKFIFNTIKVLDELVIPSMGLEETEDDFDVSSEVLSNIVVTNAEADNGDISASVNFNNDVIVKNLISTNINSANPDKLLIDDHDQTFDEAVNFENLVVSGNVQVNLLNGIDLDTDVARTDEDNEFTKEITFTEKIAITNNVEVEEGKQIDGIDVGELDEAKQDYQGIVTVTGSLTIDQEDVVVTNMDIGDDFTDEDLSKAHVEDLFLYKDTNQILPDLTSVSAGITFKIDTMSLKSTLDDIDLTTDVMHTSNEAESTSTNVVFTGGETTLMKGIKIDAGNEMGGFDLADLSSHIYCPEDGSTITYGGVKTLNKDLPEDPPKVFSKFDVTVTDGLTCNARDFGSKDAFNVARKSQANTFSGKMTFSDHLQVTSHLTSSSGVESDDEDNVLLNDKNVADFDSSIVKNIGTFIIKTPVTMSVKMGDGKSVQIKDDDGEVDGVNIFQYLDDRVLLDEDHPITVNIEAKNMKFEEGLSLTVSEESEESSSLNFYQKDLVTYKNSLFVFNEDTELSGGKALTGNLIVNGNLIFATEIHPFGIDLQDLSSKALSKSKLQTITGTYSISNIASMNKIIVDKIDGVVIDDLCLIDEACTITCTGVDGDCVIFKDDLTAQGGINFENLESLKMTDVLSKLDSNTNDYNLDSLHLTGAEANLDWTDDGPKSDDDESLYVSQLYNFLVTRSDKDWMDRDDDQATIKQVIEGDVTLDGTVAFEDVVLDSGVVNENTDEAVDLVAISTDGATLAGNNAFSTHKSFANIETVNAKFSKLSGVVEINDINIADYRDKALVTDDENNPDNSDFEQEMTQSMTLSNGIIVGVLDDQDDLVSGKLRVENHIDGVEVEDLVSRGVQAPGKNIPKVTFNENIKVDGNVVATGSDFSTTLKSFMTNRIKLSSSDTVAQSLKFSGDVTINNDITVDKLNNIPSNTWVKTGFDTEVEQHITAPVEFNHDKVSINGDLVSDDINDVDLSDKYEDAIKIDVDCVINGPNLIFEQQTTLVNERLSGDLPEKFNDALGDLITDLGTFVRNLYDFYSDNIVNVIPILDQEIRVAQKLDFGNIAYLEQALVPAYIKYDTIKDGNFNASLVSAVELDDNLYAINFHDSQVCEWIQDPDSNPDCFCQESIVASPLDLDPVKIIKGEPLFEGRVQTKARMFTFTLPSGTFSINAGVDSHSNTCSDNSDMDKPLVVSGVMNNPDVVDQKLNVLSPAMVAVAIKPLNLLSLCSNCETGYVKDIVMWELGDSIFAVVAFVYKVQKIHVFHLDKKTYTWTSHGDLPVPSESSDADLQFVSKLKVFKFFTDNKEKVHLFVSIEKPWTNIWTDSSSEVWIYEQEMALDSDVVTPVTGMSVTMVPITVPGLADLDVFLFQQTAVYNPQVVLLLAQNINYDLGPDLSVLLSLMYDTENNQYIPAIMPDNVQHIGSRLIGMKTAKLSNHTVLIIADQFSLSVYSFTPYQGWKVVDSVKVDDIVDFAVFNKREIGDVLNIYVIERSQTSKLFKLYSKDYMPALSLNYGRFK